MVIQSFYTDKRSTLTRRVQPPTRQRPKVILSKEARATLRLDRRAKSLRFKGALDEAWKELDDATKTIAASHHKSIRYVQNELYTGRGRLRSKRSKLNSWNAFCWKKNQDMDNGKFFFASLCSCVISSQVVRVKRRSNHLSVTIRLNTSHSRMRSKMKFLPSLLNGSRQRLPVFVPQQSPRSTTSHRH
jgi:hypothetical protein